MKRAAMLLQAARPLSFATAAPSHTHSSPSFSYGVASPAMSTGSSSHRSPSTSSDMPPPPPPPPQHPSSPNRRRSPSPHTIQQLLDTLRHQRVNTITELCRIERAAAACTRPDDARAFQAPMTQAWVRYVTGHQLLSELRGLTRGYPFSAELVREAYARVRADPRSNRSWNLAWLCLVRIRDDDDGLIAAYAVAEASKPGMWGGLVPREEDVLKLSGCFSREWTLAVSVMLKHWPVAPTWC
ncbi:hypothetical protein LMH87_011037 [Akanthomyces muscarius]|uniref:Uncharacterized protein n=1 Tax=Akanthomyces muscarius TaxID=2231603 RepID=A0A9W8Q8X6_AKAMU|nr:hypothetical protein LMH87_011037 [Akanthomyces muscarius]KAJ4150280.1 hypothetical protein LMH87_011037 [Akanthomyces muscarius]